LGQLNQLVYFDLSNNQLTGPFPVWVNRLRSLTLLNLGQNDFSGNIPVVVGEGRNGAGSSLGNMPYHIRSFISKRPQYRDMWKLVMRNFSIFYRKHHALKHIRQDLLWVDIEKIDNQDAVELEKIFNEYLKAEEKHLFTKVFEIMRNQNNGRLQDLFQNGYMVKKLGGS
jgi:hypothetical protein